VYAIKLSTVVAVQGGFSTTLSPIGSKVWPFGAHNMRHVYGKSSAGKRARCPVATNSFALYVSGGAFTLGSGTFNVEGSIGEKRKLNNIA